MAHEDKDAKITRIGVERAENGFIYHAMVDTGEGVEDHDYVYESVDDVLKAVKDDLESPHYRKAPDEKVKAAFREVKENEPEIVGETRKKKGKEAARRQAVAISLSKARGGLFKK